LEDEATTAVTTATLMSDDAKQCSILLSLAPFMIQSSVYRRSAWTFSKGAWITEYGVESVRTVVYANQPVPLRPAQCLPVSGRNVYRIRANDRHVTLMPMRRNCHS
jgi:hypothetical protein